MMFMFACASPMTRGFCYEFSHICHIAIFRKPNLCEVIHQPAPLSATLYTSRSHEHNVMIHWFQHTMLCNSSALVATTFGHEASTTVAATCFRHSKSSCATPNDFNFATMVPSICGMSKVTHMLCKWSIHVQSMSYTSCSKIATTSHRSGSGRSSTSRLVVFAFFDDGSVSSSSRFDVGSSSHSPVNQSRYAAIRIGQYDIY